MIFKIKYVEAGGHVHCSLFSTARPGTTFAKCGDFCVRVDEFAPMRNVMTGVLFEPMIVQGASRESVIKSELGT